VEEQPIKIRTSEDLDNLQPQTEREYLMIMFPTQRRILQHLEKLNGFKTSAEGRLSRLEASFTVGGLIVISALLGLALKVIFGG
jgi:hypothetical protein